MKKTLSNRTMGLVLTIGLNWSQFAEMRCA
jgi:hypothetical protein